MTRIDELIATHCPNGVEFRSLKDVCRIRNGKDHKPLENGQIPVYGSGGVMRHVDTAVYEKPSVLIPRKGSLGNLYYVDEPFWTVDTIFYTEIDESIILPKFLYYFLITERLENLNQAGGVPSLTQSVLNLIRIPVPPLEIQREISSLLSKMEQLEAELEAELEARERQYAHYRDTLLKFGSENGSGVRKAVWSTLGEICSNVSSGGTPLKSRSDYYNGDVPWLRTNEVRFETIHKTAATISDLAVQETPARWIPADCVIVAISGATAGRSAVNAIPLTTNQHCCNLEIDPLAADYRFVFHWVASNYERLKSLGRGARSDLNVGIIKKFPIPIPSLDEQRRVVSVLDKFDSLTRGVQVGLPAEIAARRKQYEHYRDKLLTFDEIAA